MNLLHELQSRFQPVLAELVDDPAPYVAMIRTAQDARFGDYQANFAMSLKKVLGENPRQIAEQIASRVDLAELCDPPEIAGPGFINLRISQQRIVQQLQAALTDPRLGTPLADKPLTMVVDYSSPNVAKPMHVGHIRSTVIGDSLARTLRFVGHRVITDNHIGDWGTQFGMILYGYKHLLDPEAYAAAPVAELSRLYRLVYQLISYHKAQSALPALQQAVASKQQQLAAAEAEAGQDKQAKKKLRQLRKSQAAAEEDLREAEKKIAAVESDASLAALAAAHGDIGQQVQQETARLHEGDAENRRLWHEFLPSCRDEMQKIYQRLDVVFDHELGESFYHEMLPGVVERLQQRQLARLSDGAVCVFLEGFATPMIIQKQDGAYLYATTDLATIEYRLQNWQPDLVLYVVDHRQSEHFAKLFAAARRAGADTAEFRHLGFGTVNGKDGKPFKTKEGAHGLELLLDAAVEKAYLVVRENSPDLDDAACHEISQAIGHAAVKYFDLSNNRETDYVFDEEAMVRNEGNTATYIQYSYARAASILRKGQADIDALLQSPEFELAEPLDRALALEILRFPEAVSETLVDFRPNLLTNYAFSLASTFARFHAHVPVLKAPTPTLRDSRMRLCHLTMQCIRKVLELLGIHVVERM